MFCATHGVGCFLRIFLPAVFVPPLSVIRRAQPAKPKCQSSALLTQACRTHILLLIPLSLGYLENKYFETRREPRCGGCAVYRTTHALVSVTSCCSDLVSVIAIGILHQNTTAPGRPPVMNKGAMNIQRSMFTKWHTKPTEGNNIVQITSRSQATVGCLGIRCKTSVPRCCTPTNSLPTQNYRRVLPLGCG